MVESPAKRRKISNNDTDEQGGVAVEIPLCERTVCALISPETTPSATFEGENEARAVAIQVVTEQAALSTIITQSNRYLSPKTTCWKHPKGKTNSLKAPCENCADLLEDQEPPLGSLCTFEFRLGTLKPVPALKRWLLNPNFSFDGSYADRREELTTILSNGHITSEEMRVAIAFASNQIMLSHESISALYNYLLRWPYVKNRDPMPEADDPRSYPNKAATEAMSDQDLYWWLSKSAIEVDYLHRMEEDLWQEILEEKWDDAKFGNVSEVTELLRLGFVTKAMVGEYCGVPDV
ncbi:hypothetical protein Slin15195_G116970 [Septoria linicola]|uniref:Uncharacterized protein n=1 Tax=Septoria linicola TaxID=215465 RepID=A0A9Q9B6J3_9PEZI|nr:hypothetical protein Slin15195_G116970 [Septoria linicola]